MKFKYYHGTSSIFLDLIQKFGLGGINPNIIFKNLDVLKFLYNEAEKFLTNNPEYLTVRATTKAMTTQGTIDYINSNGNIQQGHFRHHNTYVALSKLRAITYASQNKYGSEILSRCVHIIELLQSINVKVEIPPDLNLFGIDKMSNRMAEPILIEISEIHDNDLCKEDGKTAKEALDFLRVIMPTLTAMEKLVFFQHCNFELLKPIPSDKLRFYKLTTKGVPGTENFSYKLIEL